jgi:hypothetical protein
MFRACLLTDIFLCLHANSTVRPGRWKWGSSNVTGKVDEVVHNGQAQVKSNKVRYHRFLRHA